MPTQLQLRGGTTTQHASFTGLAREVTVDTTQHTLIVHDGTTAGGHELALADLSNVTGTVGATYGISAETTTGGVNLRLTGSDSSTDDVKLAAGTNITLTRTDANTVTIEAAGGAGTGTVNSGVAKKLAYYSATGTAVDDVAGIEWNSATTTLTVTGTVAADNFVSGGTGTPNFTSETDLEIITNHSVTDKTFTFTLTGDLEFAQNGGLLFQGAGASQVTALGSLEIGAGAAGINIISVGGAVTLSPTTQVDVDGDVVLASGYQLKFDATPMRVVTAPSTSAGAAGDKAGDIAFDGTNIYYCTANYGATTTYPSTTVVTYSGFYPSIVKGSVPQPQAGWQFIYNSVTYVLAANAVENNPGEWMCQLTGTISVTAGEPVTVGPAPVTNIWVKSAWATTGAW